MAIEKMVKVISGAEYDSARDVQTLFFADCTALFVSGESLRRRKTFRHDNLVYMPGCEAHMELVDGRWTLARVEEPKK